MSTITTEQYARAMSKEAAEEIPTPAPAYAQALDQLRAERDDLRAQLTIAEANSATSRAALEDGLAYQKQLQSERNAAIERADRAESSIRHADDESRAVTSEMLAAVKHSDDLRAQLEAVTAERDLALAFMGLVGRVYERPRGSGETIDQWGDRLTTAIYDDAEVNLTAKAIPTPRTPTDLEERTGPVAFESNQLRDENVRLRDENATLAAELDGTRSRLTMTTRDLDAAERTVAALRTVAHAIVSAVAKGAP